MASLKCIENNKMRIIRRRIFYSIIGGVAIIGVSVWYFPNHIWTTISQDGYGDEDKGKGVGMTTWKALSGAIVDEVTATYSSSEDARKEFEEELEDSGKIIERTDERVVKVLGDPQTKQGAARIIRLQDRKIDSINAGSVKYALLFEESWLKLW
jgi:hypothetical protein